MEPKTNQTVAEKLAKLEKREWQKHLKRLCVECGTPFGMHTREQTYLCAMNRS